MLKTKIIKYDGGNFSKNRVLIIDQTNIMHMDNDHFPEYDYE